MINKPAVAKYQIEIDSAKGNTQMAVNNGCEIVGLIVTGGSADVTVEIYDGSERKMTVASNQGESFPYVPTQPIPIKNGIQVIFTQGGIPFNGRISFTLNN